MASVGRLNYCSNKVHSIDGWMDCIEAGEDECTLSRVSFLKSGMRCKRCILVNKFKRTKFIDQINQPQLLSEVEHATC